MVIAIYGLHGKEYLPFRPMSKKDIKEADEKFEYLKIELSKIARTRKKPNKASLEYWYWLGKEISAVIKKLPNRKKEDEPHIHKAVRSIAPQIFSLKAIGSKRINDFLELSMIISAHQYKTISQLSWTNWVDLYDIDGLSKESRAFEFIVKKVENGSIKPTQDEVRRLAPKLRLVLSRRDTSMLNDKELNEELEEAINNAKE